MDAATTLSWLIVGYLGIGTLVAIYEAVTMGPLTDEQQEKLSRIPPSLQHLTIQIGRVVAFADATFRWPFYIYLDIRLWWLLRQLRREQRRALAMAAVLEILRITDQETPQDGEPRGSQADPTGEPSKDQDQGN